MCSIAWAGSPPHTRGKQTAQFSSRAKSGITPAYAGKTIALAEVGRDQADHPRIRGENLHKLINLVGKEGSPPHTRGKHIFGLPIMILLQDHPRIRGENCLSSLAPDPVLGSPPHTRGKPSMIVPKL